MARFKLRTAEGMDIRDAVLDTSNIIPLQLNGYAPQVDADGDAYARKGGYALSIKLIKRGSKAMCLRCWMNGMVNESQIDYLVDVANLIKKNTDKECTYFIDFNIVERLLRVEGVELPGLLMDWIEGDTLCKYVMKNSGYSSQQIKAVAQKFAKMCDVFNKRNISHGDLSSVNIIIKPDGSLKLIDYDSLYSPSMGRKSQFIAGTADYQHPGRKSHPYYEAYTDYFSQHVIYTALLMMAEDSSLRPDKELKNLLFYETDLANANAFRQSDIVKRGRRIGNAEITKELDLMERALASSFSSVPKLSVTTQSSPSSYYVNYCTACGNKFQNGLGLAFCTACGAKRHVYRE